MSDQLSDIRLALPMDQLISFCRRWDVIELSLFGSVLRDDFAPDSDIDLLVTFGPKGPRTLKALDEMHAEIENILGRPVDFVERSTIEKSRNYIRRRAILNSARTIYVA